MDAKANEVIASIAEHSAKIQESVKGIDKTMEDTEKNLASLREAIDNFEARWRDVQKKFGETLALSLSSAYGIEAPCILTQDEKLSVFGGRQNIAELCKRLKEGCYQKVIVMTGAGISVSAGISDFRSPGSGLYETLDLKHYQLPSAKAVFDILFFKEDPKPFFMLSKELFYTQDYKPTAAHYFIKLLSDKGLLHRCYTQNVDGLDKKAGISEDLLVEAHGTYDEATCTNPDCKKKYDSATEMKKVVSAIMADKIPTCDSCTSGVVKPDVVFFGEDLPGKFKTLLETDFKECDLLIVMGTSLQVQPFCSLVQRVKQTTPRLLINKERVGNFTLESEGGYRDVAMLEECDAAVYRICELCDWSQEMSKLVQPKNQSGKKQSSIITATATARTKDSAAGSIASPQEMNKLVQPKNQGKKQSSIAAAASPSRAKISAAGGVKPASSKVMGSADKVQHDHLNSKTSQNSKK